MRTGIGDSPYIKRYGFNKAMKVIKDLGYDCIDMDLADTTTELWTCGEAGFEKKLLEQKKIVEEAGLEIFQVHGPWRWPPQDTTDEQRAERFEKMAKGIRETPFSDAGISSSIQSCHTDGRRSLTQRGFRR